MVPLRILARCKGIGDFRKAPWAMLDTGSAKRGLAATPSLPKQWRRYGRRRSRSATKSERPNRDRRLQPTLRVRRPSAPERPRHGQAYHDRGAEGAPPVPWKGKSSPARLPFPPALLAKAHLFGEIRTRLGVIRCDHGIIGGEPPFLSVFVRGQIVLSPQMPLQRLEFSPIFQAHEIFSRD